MANDIYGRYSAIIGTAGRLRNNGGNRCWTIVRQAVCGCAE